MTRRRMIGSARGARRVVVVLAALIMVVGAAALGASPAAAGSTGDLVGTGRGTTIHGTVADGPLRSYWAGELRLRIDDGDEVVAYCIDLQTSIDVTTGTDLREVDWATSGIADLDRVTHVLHAVDAGTVDLPGTPDQRAAAIQAAIWHLTDRFDLDRAANAPDLVEAYDRVLAGIPVDGLPAEPAPSLTVTPLTATARVGEVAGPFTVSTTASVVQLERPSGVEVVDWETGAARVDAVDGTRLGVRAGEPGEVTLTLTATATVHAGRAFARLDDEGRPVVQRLILGTTSVAGTGASITVQVEVPTTTTVPETTTTTVPETTTTVPETTTTTAPATTTTTHPVEVLGVTVQREDLARTGRSTGLVVGIGLAAVVGGAVLVLVPRRHRTG